MPALLIQETASTSQFRFPSFLGHVCSLFQARTACMGARRCGVEMTRNCALSVAQGCRGSTHLLFPPLTTLLKLGPTPQPSKAAARCHSLLATPPKNAISSFGFPQKNKNKQQPEQDWSPAPTAFTIEFQSRPRHEMAGEDGSVANGDDSSSSSSSSWTAALYANEITDYPFSLDALRKWMIAL